MQIYKSTLYRIYFYFALMVLALSACYIMYSQETDGEGGGRTAIVGTILLAVWLGFGIKLFKKELIITKPSGTITLYATYCLWAFFISTVSSIGENTFRNIVDVMVITLFPLVLVIVTYYHALNNEPKATQKMFLIMTLMFAVTYYTFYDIENILMNRHLGSSYYCLFMLPLVMSYPSKLVKVIGLLIVSIAIFSSVKRGGVLALLVSTFAYVVANQITAKRNRFTHFVIMILTIGILGMIFAFIGTLGDSDIFERFENIGEDNGSGRTEVWAETWRLINTQDADTYIIGNGYNKVLENSRELLSAHDDYLEAWYDYGIIGFVLYTISVLSLIWLTIKALRKKYEYASQLAMLTSIVIILSLISHIALYFWFSIVLLNIAFFAGNMRYQKVHEGQNEEED